MQCCSERGKERKERRKEGRKEGQETGRRAGCFPQESTWAGPLFRIRWPREMTGIYVTS
jgi:hypothetical protein